MSIFEKGGRGREVPYESVMYRIPKPVKPSVELLADSYRLICQGHDFTPTERDEYLQRIKKLIILEVAKAVQEKTRT